MKIFIGSDIFLNQKPIQTESLHPYVRCFYIANFEVIVEDMWGIEKLLE